MYKGRDQRSSDDLGSQFAFQASIAGLLADKLLSDNC